VHRTGKVLDRENNGVFPMQNDGWIMQPPAGTGVPVGAYQGEFVGVENIENEHGLGYKWSLRITVGEYKGYIPCRITDRKVRPTTACGRMLSALAGRTISQGESVDPAQFVGKTYTIIVEATKSGGTRVATVAPIKQ